MAKRYSVEVKKDAISMADTGIRFWEIGMHLNVSGESVRRWWHRWNDGVVTYLPYKEYKRPDITWNVFDKGKDRFVGDGYVSEKDAREAVYEFL